MAWVAWVAWVEWVEWELEAKAEIKITTMEILISSHLAMMDLEVLKGFKDLAALVDKMELERTLTILIDF